jgi:hypothetical protein
MHADGRLSLPVAGRELLMAARSEAETIGTGNA